MGNEPKYKLVKQDIYDKIMRRELMPGDKLPTEPEYAEMFSVSTMTIRTALGELASEGHITRIKGKGSFVCNTSTKANRSLLVSLILTAEDYKDVSYMKIICGAQKVLSAFNYSLIVEWVTDDSASERDVIQKMIDRNVDAFLIYPFDPAKSRDNYKYINEKKIPYVLIDRYDIDYPSYYVGCNNYDGAFLAAKELIRLKHTKIKFIGYHFFLSSEQERYDGYCKAMRAASLPPGECIMYPPNYEKLAAQISKREVTALVCCNDKIAVNIIKNLQDTGIRVPDDISVFGFDDWAQLTQTGEKISTVKQDFEEIGSLAGNAVINAINSSFVNRNVKFLSGVTIISRYSTTFN